MKNYRRIGNFRRIANPKSRASSILRPYPTEPTLATCPGCDSHPSVFVRSNAGLVCKSCALLVDSMGLRGAW